MIFFGTAASAAAHRRGTLVDGFLFYKSEWMDTGEDPQLSPTVALIEQPADYELIPHFHCQNQFQVFIYGNGTLGAHRVSPIMVHYAGAYTGYGPLAAGPAGLKYFTMRPVHETGFTPISELRDKGIRGPKRHASSEPLQVATDAELSHLRHVSDAHVIPQGADGMGVQCVWLPPGAAWAATHSPRSHGQFVMVISGRVSVEARELGQWEHAYITAEEGACDIHALEGGAQLLLLFVPLKDDVYRNVPGVQPRTGEFINTETAK